MCGIAGYFSLKSDPPTSAVIRSMIDTLGHRGPDDEGIEMFPEGGLGHRRLNIMDLSDAGHQPMFCDSQDKRYCIVFNGEIYNFSSIKDKLSAQGVTFKSNCDTEILLAAFCRYGERLLDDLVGQFAFAVWDNVEKRLVVAVDRFSVKQAYYYIDDNKFIFASEVKALIAAGVPTEVNHTKILEYQALRRTFGTQTFFRNIKRIPAGTLVTVDLREAKTRIHTWYSIREKLDNERMREYASKPFRELTSIGEKLFLQSVSERLQSDAPVGILCSGGVDSSLIVGAAAELSNSKARIYTAGIPEIGKDETAFARTVCDYFGVRHNVFTVTQPTFLPRLPSAIYQNDEPLTFGNSIPMYGTCDLAKKDGIKVLLTGEGADEVFGGYRKYSTFMRYCKLKKMAHFLPKKGCYLHSQVEGIMDTWKLTGNGSFFEKKSPIEFLPGVQQRLMLEHELFQKFDAMPTAQHNSRTLAFMAADLYDYLGQLLERQDRMGMWASVECRVPFVDHRVIEYAVHLPLKYKLGLFENKILLRKIARKYLPRCIACRPKKGFGGPTWGYVLPKVFKDGFYQSEFGINPLQKRAETDSVNVRRDVWKLLNIELWGRIFIWNQDPNELAENYCSLTPD